MGPPPHETASNELDGRRRVYRIIARAPGVHVREIERLADLGYGAVEYHLRHLEEEGLVRAVESDQRKTYFTIEFPKADRDIAAALRVETARRLLVALLSFGELGHGELVEVSGVGLSSVSHHAGRLARKGLVVSRQEGRRTLFRLANPRAVERALVLHGNGVGDAALDAYISIWTEWRRPREPHAAGEQGTDTLK